MDDFKFKIGDTVTTVNIVAELAMHGHGLPRLYSVIGRHYEECYGGIQRHYSLQSHDGSVKVTEPCVLASNDQKVIAIAEQHCKFEAERLRQLWSDVIQRTDLTSTTID